MRVNYAGLIWEAPSQDFPPMAEEPKNVPLCPYCDWKGVRSEARPKWVDVENKDGTFSSRFQTSPMVLSCNHPCHAARPFVVEVADTVWQYAAKLMEIRESPEGLPENV